MQTIIDDFSRKWIVASTTSPKLGPENDESLAKLERDLGVVLPQSYVDLMFIVGEAWTPHILDSVVEEEADLPTLTTIYSFEDAATETKDWWSIGLPAHLFAFAGDAMGNKLCFDIRQCAYPRKRDLPVYFFDHDENTSEQASSSLLKLLADYMSLRKTEG